MKFKVNNNKIYKFDSENQFVGKCMIEEKNLLIDVDSYDDYVLQMLYLDENLMYMFAEENIDIKKRNSMLKRFIPNEHINQEIKVFELEKYIDDHLNQEEGNVSFFSFISEGLMGIVFRDIFKYNLAKGLIDINQTDIGVEQGVDGCFFDLESNIFILGEAKFYKSYSSGVNKIMDNFSNNIENKLKHFFNIATVNVLDNLTEEIIEISMEEFLREYQINFGGFVLHEPNKLKYEYEKKQYKKIADMKNNIKKEINSDINLMYAYYIHLPIKSKREIILQLILKADEERSKLSGVNKIYVK